MRTNPLIDRILQYLMGEGGSVQPPCMQTPLMQTPSDAEPP